MFYFYAARRVDLIVQVSVLAILCKISLNFALTPLLGIGGIALSTSAVGFLRLFLSLFFLHRILGSARAREFPVPMLLTLAAGGAAVAVGGVVAPTIRSLANRSSELQLVAAAAAVVLLTTALFVAFQLFVCRQWWRQALASLKQKSPAEDVK
jgi:peptidoglycan biosynthesis protein MviN/MurJ (putative lipid II flippase)